MVPGAPTNWVELKTSASIRDDRDMANFERKLMKFWIQSFLLGVPKIIVGFRSQDGVLEKLEEIKTEGIPVTAAQRGVKTWNANMCINFGAGFLECKFLDSIIVSTVLHCFPMGFFCFRWRLLARHESNDT